MSLILIYLSIVFYIFMFDIEIEYLFLYVYISTLILSPLKNIKKDNFNFKEIESHFFITLVSSSIFLLFYGIQMLYYDNVQVGRFLFHIDSHFVPGIFTKTINFYMLWFTDFSDFPNNMYDFISSLFKDILLSGIKLLGLPIAFAIVIGSIVCMIVTGSFFILINLAIIVLILGSMILPFFIANLSTMKIGNNFDLISGATVIKYLELSYITLFFIFVAV